MTRAPSEATIQAAIVAHFRRTYEGRIIHPANGGRRGRLEAIRFKAMGVEAGVPDLIAFTPRGVYCLEVKTDQGRLSAAQRAFIADLQDYGFDVATVHSVDEAKAAFKAWSLPPKAATLSAAEYRTGF